MPLNYRQTCYSHYMLPSLDEVEASMSKSRVTPFKSYGYLRRLHHDHIVRRVSYLFQRLDGYPELEVVSHSKKRDTIQCPNGHIVRKYIPALRKCVDLPVPCGHCFYCQHKKQNGLIFRLVNHAKLYKNFIYVTLTYDDSHLPLKVEDLRSDITKFIKRFRKELNDRTFSYYMVCEKGDLKDRPHFHLLLFWNGPRSKNDVSNLVRAKWHAPVRNLSLLSDLFVDGNYSACIPDVPIGIVYIDLCVDQNTSNNIASYVSKYVSDGTKKQLFRSWSLGLGRDILSVDFDLLAKMSYLRMITYMPNENKYTVSIPRYYKQKIFTQSELDCFFADYLVSDEYKSYLAQLRDPVRMKFIADIYNEYEERCINAYKLRCAKKLRKLKLL